MVDGTYVKIYRLATPESALDRGESFVGAHSLFSGKLGVGDIGANDIDSIESRFGGNALRIPSERERSLGDLDHEMLSHLETVESFAHS